VLQQPERSWSGYKIVWECSGYPYLRLSLLVFDLWRLVCRKSVTGLLALAYRLPLSVTTCSGHVETVTVPSIATLRFRQPGILSLI